MRRFRAASAAFFIGVLPAILFAAVQDYSTNPANNTAAPPNGAPEGMAPSTVNDTMRQMMTNTVIEAQVNRVKYLNSVAGTNTITASMTPNLTAYSAGMIVVGTAANAVTGAATLKINSLVALNVLKADGDALVANDIVTAVPFVLVLDAGADDWILLNPQASVNGIAFSDLARLSQPSTFTGLGVVQSTTTPFFEWNETDAAANNRRWIMDAAAEQFRCRIINDNGSGSVTWCTVDRTGTTIDNINLQATSVQVNGSGIWTAANDGSGSGLDADLLDGNSSGAFAAASHTHAGGDITSVPSSGVISSGTYTPTFTGVNNIDSVTATSAQWMRLGNVVTVSGGCVVDAITASASTSFRISLPVASNLTTFAQLGGAGGQAATSFALIDGDVANDTAFALFISTGSTAIDFTFHFTYLIN